MDVKASIKLRLISKSQMRIYDGSLNYRNSADLQLDSVSGLQRSVRAARLTVLVTVPAGFHHLAAASNCPCWVIILKNKWMISRILLYKCDRSGSERRENEITSSNQQGADFERAMPPF